MHFAAPVIITPDDNGSQIGGTLPPGGNQHCKINLPVDGITVKVTLNEIKKLPLCI